MEISNRLLFVSQKSTVLTFPGYKCGVTLFSISHAAKSICSNFTEDRFFFKFIKYHRHIHRILSPGVEGDGAWSLVQPLTASKAMADSGHVAFKRPQPKRSRRSCFTGKPHGRSPPGVFVPSADHCQSLCLPESDERSRLFTTRISQRQHQCSLAALRWHGGLRPGLWDVPQLNTKGEGGKDQLLAHLWGKEVAVVTCSMWVNWASTALSQALTCVALKEGSVGCLWWFDAVQAKMLLCEGTNNSKCFVKDHS